MGQRNEHISHRLGVSEVFPLILSGALRASAPGGKVPIAHAEQPIPTPRKSYADLCSYNLLLLDISNYYMEFILLIFNLTHISLQ